MCSQTWSCSVDTSKVTGDHALTHVLGMSDRRGAWVGKQGSIWCIPDVKIPHPMFVRHVKVEKSISPSTKVKHTLLLIQATIAGRKKTVAVF